MSTAPDQLTVIHNQSKIFHDKKDFTTKPVAHEVETVTRYITEGHHKSPYISEVELQEIKSIENRPDLGSVILQNFI